MDWVQMRWLAVPLAISAALCGCGTTLGTLLQPQELSENYAAMPGTIAESHWRGTAERVPALVDGDPETIGETAREIVIVMPEPRAIRRIVTRNSNYEDVILYVGGRGENEWKMVTQIKQNTKPSIEINLSAITDRIRLRIGNTHDDQFGTPDRRVVRGIVGFPVPMDLDGDDQTHKERQSGLQANPGDADRGGADQPPT